MYKSWHAYSAPIQMILREKHKWMQRGSNWIKVADADLNARLFEVNMCNGFINLAKLLITLTTDVTRWAK